jgi:hypothetical protein
MPLFVGRAAVCPTLMTIYDVGELTHIAKRQTKSGIKRLLQKKYLILSIA